MQVTWNSGRLRDAGFFFFLRTATVAASSATYGLSLTSVLIIIIKIDIITKWQSKAEFEWKTPAYFNHTTSPALAQHYSSHSPSPHGQFLMNRNLLPCLACHTPQPCWLVLPVTSALDFTLDMWQAESGMLIYYKITTEITPLRQTKL